MGKVCEDGDKSLQKPPQKFVNDNTKITAGDRGGSDSQGGSNALFVCLTLITDFVPYRWNIAENYNGINISAFAITRVRVTHTKDARTRKLGILSVLIVRGHVLRLIKGVLNTKSRHLGSM